MSLREPSHVEPEQDGDFSIDVFAPNFVPPPGKTEIDRLEFVALLRADQFQRFRQGERRPIERYLEHFSATLDDETAVDLIYGEWLLRSHLGENPDQAEYLARFPQYESILRGQLLLLMALEDEPVGQTQPRVPTGELPGRLADGTGLDEAQGKKSSERTWPTITGYRILGELGRGSMGVVYHAEQIGLKRLVALKLLQTGADASTFARFQREMETVARLRHRNIVHIYDVGVTADGRPYFAMEWVPGGSLARRMNGTAQPVRWAAQLIADLANAVQAAHDAGVVHRDLKPTNILLAPPGEHKDQNTLPDAVPCIIDFGLAKQLDQMTATTADGALVGTPCYMSPEQAEGRTSAVGPATDVYSLGAILYEALTGAPPLRGHSLIATLAKISNEEPVSIQRINPRVHRDLETICIKCLRKEPKARYADAKALENDLRLFLAGEPIEARPVGGIERFTSWCRRRRALAAAIFLGLAVLLFFLPGWMWYQFQLSASHHREQTAQQLVGAAELAKSESDKARKSAEELARTQEYFAHINRTRELTAERLPGWTWAGLKDLKRAATLQTTLRDMLALRIEAARCLAGVDLRLTTVLAKDLPQVMVAFSPDGKHVAVADFRSSGLAFSCSVRLIDTATGNTVQSVTFPTSLVLKGLQSVPDGARSLAFTPNGDQLLVGSRSGWLFRWHLDDVESKADSWKVIPGMPVDFLYVPPNGRTVTVASRQHDTITLLDLASGNVLTQITNPAAVDCLVPVPNRNLFASESKGIITFSNAETLRPDWKKPIKANAWPFAFDPTGEMMVGDEDDKIVFLHLDSGTIVRAIGAPKTGIAHRRTNLLRFNRDASLVLTLSYIDDDRTLRLWETAGGKLVATIVLQGKDFADAAFHPTKDALMVAHGGKVELFEIGGLNILKRVAHHCLPVRSMDFMVNGDLACTALSPGPLRAATFWNADSDLYEGNLAPTFWTYNNERELPAPSIVAAHPRSRDLALLTLPSVIQLWSPQTKFGPHVKLTYPSDVCFDGTGARLWTISDRQATLHSWHWPTFKEASVWRDELRVRDGTGQLYCMAVRKEYAALGSRDGPTFLIRTHDTSLAKELGGGDSPTRSVAINDVETLVASGSQQGTLRVFSIPTGRMVASFTDHRDAIQSIAFHPDGKSLATGSSDGTIHLYRLTDGSWKKWITFRTGMIRQLRFHPNGRRLFFIVEGETAVRVWNLDRLNRSLEELGIY